MIIMVAILLGLLKIIQIIYETLYMKDILSTQYSLALINLISYYLQEYQHI